MSKTNYKKNLKSYALKYFFVTNFHVFSNLINSLDFKMAKQTTPAELAQAVSELDFNVSQEEIIEAQNSWNQREVQNFTQIKSVTHPM